MTNQPQWHYLTNRWQKNNLPHALLLTGQSDFDKAEFVIEFAKFLLCSEKKLTACGTCRNCQLMQSNGHPDFHYLQPEEQGKAIRIDPVRELITQLNQTAQQSGYKIALINPADALNQAAANALLKTLEEPSANTIIFLISEQPSLLLATIRSRCQIIRFIATTQTIPPEQLAQQQKLLSDLENITADKQDPVKTAEAWVKVNINTVLDDLITVIMNMIRSQAQQNLFFYLDKLYIAKRQILASNLNQQLLLEELFCSWKEFGSLL